MRAASLIAELAIVDAFGNPHATFMVDIHVSRIVEKRRACPQRDFKIIRQTESLYWNVVRCGRRHGHAGQAYRSQSAPQNARINKRRRFRKTNHLFGCSFRGVFEYGPAHRHSSNSYPEELVLGQNNREGSPD